MIKELQLQNKGGWEYMSHPSGLPDLHPYYVSKNLTFSEVPIDSILVH